MAFELRITSVDDLIRFIALFTGENTRIKEVIAELKAADKSLTEAIEGDKKDAPSN